MSDRLFEIKDKTGKLIYLTKERWSHITLTHAEMANYFDEIQKTIENPLRITEHIKGDLRNYYLYLKNRKHPEKYLRVIVKYLNGKGYVITAHFVRYIK